MRKRRQCRRPVVVQLVDQLVGDLGELALVGVGQSGGQLRQRHPRHLADLDILGKLNSNDQVLWRYVNASGEPTEISNPNGSLENIAGICNETRNVAGLMPHPERASEPLLGSADGRTIFESLVHWLAERTKAKAA